MRLQKRKAESSLTSKYAMCVMCDGVYGVPQPTEDGP